MSEEQGVGGKIPILQPDAVGGGGKRPTPHPTIRALSEIYIDKQPAYQQSTSKEYANNMSEEQGVLVGGKTPILQPDAVGGGGKRPTPHPTIRALSKLQRL
jgi:hypothetical protein